MCSSNRSTAALRFFPAWSGDPDRYEARDEGWESVMSRVLGEVVGRVGVEVQVERGPLGPLQFWRGSSRYLVGELLDAWVETPAWWQGDDAGPGGASADLVATREVWRVEAVRAGRSRTSFAGVYDLSWDAAGNRWWLVRVHD
jgi:hypothetical protein